MIRSKLITALAHIYRVIQEAWSIYRETTVSVTVRRTVRMNTCLILIGDRDGATKISRPDAERESDLSTASSADVKNECTMRLLLLYYFMACPRKLSPLPF